MSQRASLCTNLLMLLVGAPSLLAAVELPVETLKKMTDVNRVNGRCGFNNVEIRGDEGQKSLEFELTVDGRSIPSSIVINQGESLWSESQGVNQAREPFWRFLLDKGDRTKAGAVTSMDWNVKGDEFKTTSLSLKFIEPGSLAEVPVTCL